MIWILLSIWLGGWLFSSIMYWIWWDRELDADFYEWSLFSFIPILPIMISLIFMLIKIAEWAEKRWNIHP